MKRISKKSVRQAVYSIFVMTALLATASCSRSKAELSFTSQLDTIDTYIRTGQPDDALKVLKQAEKKAFSAPARIGIYKRYMTLGETKRAEKVLVKGLKNLPNERTLLAIYSQFLLRQGRNDDALKEAEGLRGSQYGSLYSEAKLKKISEGRDYSSAEEKRLLLNSDLATVYYDAFSGTKNNRWLINSAVTNMYAGDYKNAASLQERNFSSDKEAFFWALLQYDSGNYDVCVENLANITDEKLASKAAVLASDAFQILDESDQAEEARAKVLEKAKNDKSLKVAPSIKVNSAIWAQEKGQYTRGYKLLMEVLNSQPEYVPALLTYGKFAYMDSLPKEMTPLEASLWESDLRTDAMQVYDDRPKYLVSDALQKMQQAIMAQAKRGESGDGRLIVERLNLYLNTEKNLNEKSRQAAIWKVLEQNEIDKNVYQPLLVQYAVHELLLARKTDEARSLFTNYLDSRYDLKGEKAAASQKEKTETDIFGGQIIRPKQEVPEYVVKSAFGDRAAQFTHGLSVWECECAAYFTLLDKNSDAAKRLYEYVLFETGGVHNVDLADASKMTAISPMAGDSSAINLAMIYSSTGERKKALALYGLVAGRIKDGHLKSQILYREALIQKATGDLHGAIISLEYAITIDPQNAEARLLKRELKGF